MLKFSGILLNVCPKHTITEKNKYDREYDMQYKIYENNQENSNKFKKTLDVTSIIESFIIEKISKIESR